MRSPVPAISEDQLDDIDPARSLHDQYAAGIHAKRAEQIAEMKGALQEARAVIAGCLRANAPDWFGTDEDIARHVTIKRIDAALANAGG